MLNENFEKNKKIHAKMEEYREKWMKTNVKKHNKDGP
jgi:hypothetical protein